MAPVLQVQFATVEVSPECSLSEIDVPRADPRLVCVRREVAFAVKLYTPFWCVPRRLTCTAVQVHQGPEPPEVPPMMATISGSPSVPARTNDAGVPPTPTQMGKRS